MRGGLRGRVEIQVRHRHGGSLAPEQHGHRAAVAQRRVLEAVRLLAAAHHEDAPSIEPPTTRRLAARLGYQGWDRAFHREALA